jgi:hypothetical protein
MAPACTCTAKHPENRVALLNLAQSVAREEWERHGEEREFSWQGYAMKRVGAISYGERESDCIVRLSGPLAHVHGLEMVKRSTNVSRLDLQVTCKFDPPLVALGRVAFDAALRHFRRNSRAPRPACHATPQGVETVTLGSRSSAYFGRIYDKYAESGDDQYRGAWRFELEIKGKTASLVGRTVAYHVSPQRAAVSLVRDNLARAGLRPAPFGTDAGVRRPVESRQTTDDRRISWLAEQCRPAVTGITARGRWLDAYAALGVLNVYVVKKTKADGGQT